MLLREMLLEGLARFLLLFSMMFTRKVDALGYSYFVEKVLPPYDTDFSSSNYSSSVNYLFEKLIGEPKFSPS